MKKVATPGATAFSGAPRTSAMKCCAKETGPAFTNGDTELSIQAASHSDTAGDEDFEQHTLKK